MHLYTIRYFISLHCQESYRQVWNTDQRKNCIKHSSFTYLYFTYSYFETHFNVIIRFTPWPKWLYFVFRFPMQNFECISHLFCTFYSPRPSYPPWLTIQIRCKNRLLLWAVLLWLGIYLSDVDLLLWVILLWVGPILWFSEFGLID